MGGFSNKSCLITRWDTATQAPCSPNKNYPSTSGHFSHEVATLNSLESINTIWLFKIANWKIHYKWRFSSLGKSSVNGQLFIAMLNHQRVYPNKMRVCPKTGVIRQPDFSDHFGENMKRNHRNRVVPMSYRVPPVVSWFISPTIYKYRLYNLY